MYLPRTLPLCEPHIATWIGKSGRRYDFAVSRPAATWLDEAAVFLLVRSAADHTDVLHIGHTCSLHKRFGAARDRCPEIWRRALAAGMTHVHLRFEACTDRARQAEVDDLLAVHKPFLLLQPAVEDVPVAEAPPALAEVAVEAPDEDVLVPYRARLKIMRLRDPHIDIEAFDADLARSDLPFGHAFEASRSHRCDPARECDVIHDDFDAAAPLVVVGVEAVAPVVILPSPADVAAILPVVEPAAAPLPDAPVVIVGAGPAPAEPLVVTADSARIDVPAGDVSVPAPVAAAVAEEAQPAAVAGLPAGASGAGTAGVGAAAGDDRPAPTPRGKQRSAGLLGRLLHAVSGRGSRWFGASRPQPSQEDTLVSLPAAAAASADGHDISLPSAAVDAMHSAAVVSGVGTPADRVDTAEAAATENAAGSHAAEEVKLELEPGSEPVEPVAADVDDSGLVVIGLKGEEAEAGLEAAADPVPPITDNREEAEEELPAAAETPPAEPEAADAQAAAAPVVVPAPVPVAVAPMAAAPREASGGLRAADTDAGRRADDAAKRSFGCDPGQPLVLFADAVSGEAGADILAEALFTVCGTDNAVQVIFAGEGELRGELCGRIGGAGLGERCRFLGDVGCERFRELMLAADILVIPARAGRGDQLASRAIRHGKWVLATHQAQVSCVVHGENGLLTYDNPGSLVWGIRELLERVRRQQCAGRAEAA